MRLHIMRKRREWQGYMLGHILMLDALWLTGIRSQRLECGFISCVNSTDVFSLGGESVIIESDSDQIMDEQDTRNNPILLSCQKKSIVSVYCSSIYALAQRAGARSRFSQDGNSMRKTDGSNFDSRNFAMGIHLKSM